MNGIKTNKKQEEIQEQSYHTTKTTFEAKNYEFGYVPKPKYFVGYDFRKMLYNWDFILKIKKISFMSEGDV